MPSREELIEAIKEALMSQDIFMPASERAPLIADAILALRSQPTAQGCD